ncbi:MAG: T9SS type A sorting domain-containing protein [Saprospiraceae bacterium]|nr:T9SS type A sorting domain-containing protein [Saprospiraceae bacterium]
MKKRILSLMTVMTLALKLMSQVYYIEFSDPAVVGSDLTWTVSIAASSSSFVMAAGNIRYNFNNTYMSTTSAPVFNVTGPGLQLDNTGFLGTAPNRYVNLAFSPTGGNLTITTTPFTIGTVSHALVGSPPSGTTANVRIRAFGVVPAGYTNPPPTASATNTTRIFTTGGLLITPPGTPVNGVESFPLTALPVELAEFTATAKGSYNQLRWMTETELNSEHHIVERSADGIENWQEIGRKQAAGTTQVKQEYGLEDKQPLPLGYYRLKLVDFDGKYEHSKVVSVKRDADGFAVTGMFPVPSDRKVNLLVTLPEAAELKVTVTDMVGRVVQLSEYDAIKGTNTLDIDMENFAAGTYFVKLDNGLKQLTERIVKQ